MARDKRLPDAASIDRTYGLEPVFEPGSGAPADAWLELECAFCGERFGTPVDLSAGSHSYIEDCQVCCQPLLVSIECDDAGALVRGYAQRGD